MNKQYELVKFEQDDLILDVNVSPSEDTVWLTQEAMALLFDRDQGVISRHIDSIFKEGELDRNTSMQKMHKSLPYDQCALGGIARDVFLAKKLARNWPEKIFCLRLSQKGHFS